MRILTFLAALSLVVSAQPRPSSTEQSKTIEAARASSLNYAQKLPNFICSELVEQSTQVANRLVPGDKIAIELTYFGQKEKYKVVTINGKPTTQTYQSLAGLVTGGEFGTMLFRIFDPASAAVFQWKDWTTVDKRRSAAYSYHVAREHSHHIVGYHTKTGELRTATVGQQGVVDLDVETSRVLRLTVEAVDIPKDFPVLGSTTSVEYAFVDVAGARHLLPSHAESQIRMVDGSDRNTVQFSNYRKFAAESTIDFKE